MKMGFVMSYAVGMAIRALFGIFSCLRIRMWGWELTSGIRKTMMLNGGTFGTFMAIRMDIAAHQGTYPSTSAPAHGL
ncbi:unnamed protein product [Nyctereutes procyonoides]|uniref:Reactive oxygen species modulator 1 n=1 Tax=Nyctereutes procyonoides TaxID=34880 RepID=A0A811Z4C4_NYCPR|nr:unnamed protein product [Nyctereutes procyonoides]